MGWKVLSRLTFVALMVGASLFIPGGADPAGAFCTTSNGGGGTYISHGGMESYRWSSTCDGLGDYYGKVLDAAHDGTCVTVVYDTGDLVLPSWSTCSETIWKNTYFTQSISYAPVFICKNNTGTCGGQHTNKNF
jgi:hypothetical protein